MLTRRTGWILVGLQALAIWPVWMWLAKRMAHQSHCICTLLAAAGIAILLWREKRHCNNQTSLTTGVCITASALMLGYAYLTTVVPQLLSAIPALFAFLLVLSATVCDFHRMPSSLWGLLLLLLPTVPVLQFAGGYPMRVVSTHGAATLLRLSGFGVTVDGTGLTYDGQTVWVDVACSGVNMLWVFAFVAMFLSGWRRLRWRPTLELCAVALVTALGANALRSAALFYHEAGILPPLSPSMHAGIGLVVFVMATVVLLGATEWIEKRTHTAH